MSATLNVTLNGAVAQVINTVDSSTRVNSSLGNPTLGATDSIYTSFYPVSSGSGNVITLAGTNGSWVVYVKNLGGQNSLPSGNITVQIQVTGGTLTSTANSPILPPGGVFMYWCPAESAGGVIAMTLVASVNATPVEILSAG